MNTLFLGVFLRRFSLFLFVFLLSRSDLWAQDDSLIDVDSLEKLNAIRYDLDGNGEPDAKTTAAEKVAYRTTFVLTNIADCAGYELMNDLDFNDTDPLTAGNQPSKWAKGCSGPDCVTGTQADGTTGNTGWEPICYFNNKGTLDKSDDVSVNFSSTFQGNGNTISGLYININRHNDINRRDHGVSYAGLFGKITSGATLDNLALVDVNVVSASGEPYVGGLVGVMNGGSITASCTTGYVTSIGTYSYAGGLVGRVFAIDGSSNITASYTTGDVTATSTDTDGNFSYAGGLVGSIGHGRGSITASYATGDVIATSTSMYDTTHSYAGGLVGTMGGKSSIIASYATGDATATSTDNSAAAGGLVGTMGGKSITASYATGDATATSTAGSASVGGLVGTMYGKNNIITASYATGDATGTANSVGAGGLVGYVFDIGSSGGITASYATGNAKSTAVIRAFSGGLVGSSTGGSIATSYATGDATAINTVTYSTPHAGGLVGVPILVNLNGFGSVTASYYDSEATITAGKRTKEGAQTRSALQTPTAGSGIYATWVQLELDDGASAGIDDRTQAGDPAYDLIWDFGTATQYPALKVDFDADATATEKATVAEFGPQRAPKFRRAMYDFVVVAGAAGTLVGTVQASIAHASPLSYSILSQALDGGAATTSGFAFSISNTGVLTVDSGATLTLNQVYTLMIQAGVNGSVDMAEVRIEVIPEVHIDVIPVEPSAPTSLTATAVSTTQIDLQWVAPTDTGGAAITGYQIQSSPDGNVSTFTNLYMVTDPATLTYQHTGLLAGTEYYYQVAAINSVGTGAYSDSVFATTASGDSSGVLVALEVADALRVYPNPASGDVRFAGLSSTHRYLYSVYALVGQEILSGTLRRSSLDVSALANGQYLLVLKGEDGNELLRTRMLVLK